MTMSFAEVQQYPLKCPGLYCGRVSLENGSFSPCGACPRGYQPDYTSKCLPCEGSPSFYDWFYLGFMCLLCLALHWFFIDFTNRYKHALYKLHICALVECLLAAILTILLSDPVGEMRLRSCEVKRLSDWYTMFYNPSPNYVFTIHCTQEIAYPLYTIAMIYYAFCLLLMMLFRPIVSWKLVKGRGSQSIYAALYFLPSLIVLQAVGGGLLYYSYPYITIVLSVITNACFLSCIPDQSQKELIRSSLCDSRRLAVLIGHWFLHGYGIIALTQLQDPKYYGTLLVLMPFPVVFYIFTSKFTDPNQHFHSS